MNNPTLEKLEGNINKAFSCFSSSASCSEFVKELDITPISDLVKIHYNDDWRYRFDPSSMIKALVFMKLKGFKYQTQLIGHLSRSQKDLENLGCFKSPEGKAVILSRRTFNRFIGERLVPEIIQLIDFVANKAKEIGLQKGIIFDSLPIKAVKKKASNKTFYNRREQKLKELCKFIKKNIYPIVQLDLKHNTVYTKNNFLDLITHTAMTNDFTENGSHTMKILSKQRSPSADTLLYHIKKFEDRHLLEQMFEKVFDLTFEFAKKSKTFNRALDLAIDYTDIMYYGDKADYMVVETQPKTGTTHAYKFATVSIVVNGERFILYAVPVDDIISKAEVVEKLINYAKRKVKIKRVYLDRGFFSIDVINMLESLKVKYIMPAVRNSRIKELMVMYDSPKVIKYTMGRDKTTDFNLVIVEDEGVKVVFATNIDVRGNGAYTLFDLYSRRWGIETSYRVKECFRARTTSKNYIIRLFYFMFSVVLYNLWILVNIILALFLFGKLAEKPVVTAKLFGTVLYIDPGIG